MTNNKKTSTTKEKGSKGNWGTSILLLALAGAVAALTLYIAFQKPPPPPPSPPGKSMAERVIEAVRPLMAGGMYDQACETMQAYVRGNPNDTEVRPLLAEAYFKSGKADKAEHTVDEMLQLAPRTAEMLWLKGELVRRRSGGDYMKFFTKAVEVSEGSPELSARYGVELLAVGNERQAEEYLQKAMQGGIKDVRTLGGLGELAMRQKRFRDAESLLSEAVRSDKAGGQLYRMLAEAKKNDGNLEGAVRAAAEGMKVARDKGPLHMELGEIFLLQKRRAEAAEEFAAASAYPAFRSDGAFKAARCYYFDYRYALAMKYIDDAALASPQDEEILKLKRQIENSRFGTGSQPATRSASDHSP